MPAKDPSKEELEIAQAAYWRVAKPLLTIPRLAELMDVSRTTLDRRIDRAKKKGLIANDWIFKAVPKKLFEVLAEMEDADLKRRLTEKYGKVNLPELTIVPSWPVEFANIESGKPGTEDIDDTNMRLVAHIAAKVFIERLPRMRVIGLSYGRTLYRMTDVLEYFTTKVRSKLREDDPDAKRTIVTIFGALSFTFEDKRHGGWLENSAPHLVNRLAGILGIKMCKRQFLESPVYVPPAFLDLFNKKKTGSTEPSEMSEICEKLREDEALKIVKAFVEAIPTYRDVFVKEKESSINKLDTVITSVGDLDTGFGSLPEDEPAPLLREGEREKLRDEAVGDIAGRYVTKDGTTGEPGSTIDKVNNRIFGLTIEDLETIAQRAAEEERPGVIVIASSEKKAPVISALLNRQRRKKVISELIISGDLAKKLLEEPPS